MNQYRVAFFLSVFILVFQESILIYTYYWIVPFYKYILLIPFATSVLVYFFILYLIKAFLTRKLRILYRTVTNLNQNKNLDQELNDPYLLDKLREKLVSYKIDKLKEVEELKNNERFRREFLGNVSHELKTPLFSIQGFTEILLDGGLDDPQINESYLQKIAKNTNRLIEIVEDLVLISKVESNELKLSIEKFHLYELCLEVIESLEDLAFKKNILIEVKDQNHLHYTVKGDRAKLFQVFHNLIQNAISYSPPKTKINIRFFDFETEVLIEVSDNGTGIAEEHLPRLFERFYRVDSDRSRDTGGSGLGLSIVKKILEAHGHSIQVKSKVNKGTTFSFTLSK